MRKTIKPEKELEQHIRLWANNNGIWLEVYDSKAKFTERGIYKAQGMRVGTPDLMGVNKDGIGVYIEIKSPKGKAIPSLEQRNFLSKAIDYNAFAVVVNSVDSLDEYYRKWRELNFPIDRRKYLLSILPNVVKVNGKLVTLRVE